MYYVPYSEIPIRKILFKSIHAHAKDENVYTEEEEKKMKRVHSHTNTPKCKCSLYCVLSLGSQTDYYYYNHSILYGDIFACCCSRGHSIC